MTEIIKYKYGLATHKEASGMSGRGFLQAVIDGNLPQAPISETMTLFRPSWYLELQSSRIIKETKRF
jgi:hypothetical protein